MIREHLQTGRTRRLVSRHALFIELRIPEHLLQQLRAGRKDEPQSFETDDDDGEKRANRDACGEQATDEQRQVVGVRKRSLQVRLVSCLLQISLARRKRILTQRLRIDRRALLLLRRRHLLLSGLALTSTI